MFKVVHDPAARTSTLCGLALAASVLASCGGGDSATTETGANGAKAAAAASSGVRLSADSTFDPNCGRNEVGTLFANAEVEPHLALNPARPSNLIAAWQQDRWSNGGARGVVSATSADGGATWSRRTVPFSKCAGGSFERASDPWVTIGPTGIAQQMVLAITGSVFAAGSLNAMMVARSTDGGLNWSAPLTLIQDTAPFFNDKNSMTADPKDATHIYAAWDRLQQNAGGPAFFARSTDSGISWEAARAVYDPGRTSQIIGAEVVVTSDGDLLYFFTQIDAVGGQNQSSVAVMRSLDRGRNWEPPITVSRLLSVGTRDPDTNGQVRDGSILMHAAAGPGLVVVTWQDSRFSNGVRDGVAFSQSTDGGRTWTDPVQINAAPTFAAFTPQPQIANDGLISVGYFDLRANTADPGTLPAQYFIARSTDGRTWTETRIAGPFNLANAPNANGLFVGDYVGLVSAGSFALSLLALATDDVNNRTDVFFSVGSVARATASDQAQAYRAIEAGGAPISAELTAKVSETIARTLGPKLTIRPRDRER